MPAGESFSPWPSVDGAIMCAARCTAKRRSISRNLAWTSAGRPEGMGAPPLKSQARSPLNRVSFSAEPMWIPYSSPAYLWPSCPVISAPTSQPPAAYLSCPSTPVISSCQISAIFQKFMSGRFVSGVEKPKPGSDGTITSNASAGSPPCAPGSASGPITFDQCQNVHGQPWLRISGTGSGPTPGLRMKCTGTPPMSTR